MKGSGTSGAPLPWDGSGTDGLHPCGSGRNSVGGRYSPGIVGWHIHTRTIERPALLRHTSVCSLLRRLIGRSYSLLAQPFVG